MKTLLGISIVLLAAGAVFTAPALADGFQQVQTAVFGQGNHMGNGYKGGNHMGMSMETVTVTGTVIGTDDQMFTLATDDGLLTVVIPGHDEALEDYEDLELVIGDSVTVEGLLADHAGDWHGDYCDEEMVIEGEHLMAFTINGTTIFSFEDMDHVGGMGMRGTGGMGHHGDEAGEDDGRNCHG